MAPRYTTQLNRRAGSATVSAHKDGDAYKFMNRTQAENHARKVGGEVYKPAISRVYYVKVKPALTKWPGADSRRKARPAPAPPHGAEYSYDTYPDGKKIPLARDHAWVEYQTEPYFDDHLDLRDTVYLNTYLPSHPPTDPDSDSYKRWKHNRQRIKASLEAYNHESDPGARARYLKRKRMVLTSYDVGSPGEGSYMASPVASRRSSNGPGSGWHGEPQRHAVAARLGHRRRR